MQSRNNAYFLLIVVALAALSTWGFIARPLNQGLDVVGGIRLTYEMANLTPEQQQTKSQIQTNLQRILVNRASNALGVAEPNVYKKGTDQLVVELPGFTDLDEAKQTISTTAKIQLYHAKTVSTTRRENRYSRVDDESADGAPYVTFSRRTAPDRVLSPLDPETREDYAAMIASWGDPILEGEDVRNAFGQMNGNNMQPHFTFSGEGARKLETWSRRFVNRGENIAFVLDGKVLSIAPVQDNVILSDNAFIDGQFEPKYVKQLTEMIRAGSLPVDLEELSVQKVDPTIGTQAWDRIVVTGIISVALTALFLIVYYAFPGFIALIALMLYILFTLTVMKLIGATFSLASMAAFILSIGMAVDANILVFERVKEEMRSGRSLLTAVELGFKRALSAIVDSNACTILTSIVLFLLGTGQVKGFASTLIIGVALSFFTAITVTRSLLVGCLSLGIANDPKYFALGRNWFGEGLEAKAEHSPVPIIKKRNLYFAISAALIVLGWLFVPFGGIKFNVEFLGGFEGVYRVTDQVTAPQVRQRMEQAGFEGSNVKFGTDVATNTTFAYITVPYGNSLKANDPQANQRIAEAGGFNTEGSSFTEIGPTVQQETVQNAFWGVVLSSLFIVLYLAIRFGFALGGVKNGLKFGLSAIAALLHDVFFVIGTAGIFGLLFGWEISALFLTAMLTVIGFSVHDTIVIFDRIRENLRRVKAGETFEHLVDKSITQSLARSINTSLTVIATLVILIAFGTPTPELKFMCVAMLTGIIVGTYSSIFNASPILYLWDKAARKKHGDAGGFVADAIKESKLRAQAVMAESVGTGYGQQAAQPGQPGAAGYGQVKRKSAAEQAKKVLDDDQ